MISMHVRSTPEATGRPSLRALLALPVLARPDLRWFAAESAGAGGGSGPAVRVLIVEDDPAIAEMYQMQLRHDGYEVDVAHDARAALLAMEQGAPHLVLMDVLLPGRDGFSILAEVRERWPVPVVMLSNYGDPDMVDRGRRLGAREYLVKSRVTPTWISQAIPNWLGESNDERRR